MRGVRRACDLSAHHPFTACAALSAKAGAAFGLARLFVEFPHSDFFLDAATLNQLSKPPDSLLGRLFVTQSQLDHAELPFVLMNCGRVRLQSNLNLLEGTN